MFSIASFVRIDTASVTILDARFKLTLSIESFVRIDTASVTRVDVNIKSIFSSASFARIYTVSVSRLDTEVELTLLIASCTRTDTVEKIGVIYELLSSLYTVIKLGRTDILTLRLDAITVGDTILGSCR